jgi:hypothetical protein
MPNAKRYEEFLVRLPFWVTMTEDQVINKALDFYN